jgi:uncharacterized RDD family membrane protein YckC
MTMDNNETPEVNYLANDFKAPLKYATTGQRFLNYIIDLISFYLFFIGLTAGITIVSGNMDFANSLAEINPILDRFMTLLLFATYIGLVEGVTGGKTLGKLVTSTRAVYEDGSRIEFSTGFLRGLSRAVPFEPFSAFGAHPWHDRWTDTRVVVE